MIIIIIVTSLGSEHFRSKSALEDIKLESTYIEYIMYYYNN